MRFLGGFLVVFKKINGKNKNNIVSCYFSKSPIGNKKIAMKEDLKTYVHTHLKSELDIVQRDFSNVLPELLDEYKTLIYKYTDEDDAYNILII